MKAEENIRGELESKFSYLKDRVTVPRARRIFLDADYDRFREVFEYAVKELKFHFLNTITGLDDGEKLGLIYHLADDNGITLNLKTGVPMQDPLVKSVTDIFPSADIYERELADLLGAKIEGMVEGFRYPLTDDWPAGQYPLRKSWKLENLEKKGEI
jgi:Ni,Fe-hydrogenase III component G